MQVIGVIDLAGGRAVHARGGARERYRPVEVPGERGGDADGLARFYRDRGVQALYVADLDAITGRHPHSEIEHLAACGLPIWLDAGIDSTERADAALRSGAAKAVIGLETLPSLAVLDEFGRAHDGDTLVFSLDLRKGVPVWRDSLHGPAKAGPHVHHGPAEAGPHVHIGPHVSHQRPDAIAAYAARAGFGYVLVLDLARVGTGSGLDLDLLRRVRDAIPAARLIAGGGVRHAADLRAAADAGCDAVLVASALIDGRITAADVHAISRR